MEHLLTRLGAAVGVFVGTNVDDIVVLTVLFLACRATGRPKRWQIWVGQYLGTAASVVISAVAALGLTIVPDRWAGLLGLVPLSLGVWMLIKTVRNRRGTDEDDDDSSATVATGMLSVAGLTLANGADNISLYTPMFRTVGLAESLLTVAVFAPMLAIWCLAGSWLGSHRRAIALLERYGDWIVPVVFIVIGAVILVESGVASGLH